MKSIVVLLFLVGSLAIAKSHKHELQKIKDRITTYENAATPAVKKDKDGNVKKISHTSTEETKVIKKQED